MRQQGNVSSPGKKNSSKRLREHLKMSHSMEARWFCFFDHPERSFVWYFRENTDTFFDVWYIASLSCSLMLYHASKAFCSVAETLVSDLCGILVIAYHSHNKNRKRRFCPTQKYRFFQDNPKIIIMFSRIWIGNNVDRS